uniref:Uncharacterized protein n=1 Tax=Eutreptiella gymnastica TaxID=73025 RepID=A0A7S1JFL5_9EUGL
MSSTATVPDTSLVDFAAATDPLCRHSALPLGLQLVPVVFLAVPESTTDAYSSCLLLTSPACRQIMLLSCLQTALVCAAQVCTTAALLGPLAHGASVHWLTHHAEWLRLMWQLPLPPALQCIPA